MAIRLHSCFLLAAAMLTLSGCGYSTVEPENQELITKLRTALSAKNEEWLRMNENLIEERRKTSQMSDKTYTCFKAIIEQAREGDWEGAELESLEYQRAQVPTAEQVARIRRQHAAD